MPVIEARGVTGSMSLQEGRLTITKKSMMGFGEAVSIKVSAIAAVQFKPASLLTNGYLRVVPVGSPLKSGGLTSAAIASDAIVFSRRQQPAFESLKTELESASIAS